MIDQTFTLDKLKAAMDLVKDIAPAPEFYSSKIYPASRALRFKRKSGQEVALAGPEFWQKVYAKLPVVQTDANMLGTVEVIDLDNPLREALARRLDDELMNSWNGL